MEQYFPTAYAAPAVDPDSGRPNFEHAIREGYLMEDLEKLQQFTRPVVPPDAAEPRRPQQQGGLPGDSPKPFPPPAASPAPATGSVPEAPFAPISVTSAPAEEPPRPATVQQAGPPQERSLFAAFQTEARAREHANDTRTAPPVGPPAVPVEFEEEGSAFKTKAFYHQVVRANTTLVLVFDTRAEGYPVVFPGLSEKPLAVLLPEQNRLYEVETTGIQFKLDSYDICILLIRDERTLGV